MTSDDDLPRRKTEMRREVAARLQGLSPDDFAARGRLARERLEAVDDFRKATSCLLYAPMGDEVDVSALIDGGLAAGKAIFLPLCKKSAGRMRAVRIFERGRDLVPGRFGIMEPRDGEEQAAPEDLDFVLVPGRAFDRSCHRLGRGRGYYDRFLAEVREEGCCTAAVALDLQIFDRVPAGEHDLPVSMIATESELIRLPAVRTRSTIAGE